MPRKEQFAAGPWSPNVDGSEGNWPWNLATMWQLVMQKAHKNLLCVPRLPRTRKLS
ncbi:hypothetical protein M404DRAFT_1009326 [Pisolithus tinctorius Marx 270]|uniref:Uncharacterized protein n=1 Tax=Pisolithus tinctorius Marx 270 TaxID=870435 RepID=A0A0C3MVA9_PISTI|nr:hypothetical protein M404DRAFT_1009326 [Pisolithus tinctorius Marx 270]